MSNRSLPTVTSQIPQDLRNFLNVVREIVGSELASGADIERSRQILKGELNRVVAQQHAELAGLQSTVKAVAESISPNRPCGETLAPSRPTGAQAWGAFEAIALAWDTPEYCGHQSTEVWCAEADDFELAELVGEVAYATTFTHALAANQTRWYWLRFINDEGTEGPFTTESVTATTAIDLEAVLLALTGQITESQLYQDLAARIDLIDGPADLLGSVAAQFAQEGIDRSAEIAAEAAARAAAISAALDSALAETDAARSEASTALSTARSTLEGEIATARSDAAADVLAARSDLGALLDTAEADILAADARITTVKGGLEGLIDAAEADILAADARITTVKGELEGLIDAAEADILAADARITTVKGELETDLAGAQVSLNARIDNVNAAIADIEATADFSSASDYALHALVRYDGKLYRAIQATTAPSPLPTDLAYWEKVGDYASFADGLQSNSSAIAAINTVTAGSDSANARALAAVTATVTDPTTGLASRAAVTDLDEAVADIYGAEASRFTSLSASFDYDAAQRDITNAALDVFSAAEAAARIDSYERVETSIYGASVEQFTQLSAKFGNVDGEITELNTITLDSGSALARTTASLQATIEDPATGLGSKASASEMTTAIANVYGASVESFSNINAKFGLLDGEITGVEADITDLNTVEVDSGSALARATATIKAAVEDPTTGLLSKASSSELTTAVADIYGASVDQFSQINAKFGDVDADITAINTVTSDSTSAAARALASVTAAVEDPTTGLSSKASTSEVTTAVADIYGASVSQFTNISTRFGQVDGATGQNAAAITAINNVGSDSTSAIARTAASLKVAVEHPTSGLGSKASSSELTTAVADIYGATVESFSNINAKFGLIDAEITGVEADITDLNDVSVTSDSALARTAATLNAVVNDPTTGLGSRASVTDLADAKSDIFGAEAGRFSGLEATFSYDAAQREITNFGLDVFSKAEGAARIDSYERTKADIFGASAESFSGLAVEFQGIVDANAGISELNNVSVDSESALARSVALLDASITDPTTGLSSKASSSDLTTAVADIYGASVESFSNINAEFGLLGGEITGVEADITQLNNVSVDSESALARSVASLNAEVYDPETGLRSLATITEVDSAKSDVFSASAESFTGLSAQFQDILDAKADITAINTVASDSTSASARALATVEASISDPVTGLPSKASSGELTTAVANIYGASVESFSNINAQFGDVNAAITSLNTVTADSDSALASTVAGIEAEIYDPVTGTRTLATLSELDSAKADVFGASASSFTGLSAQFQDIVDTKSDITQLNTVTVDSDSALARSVATMQAEFYDPITGDRSVATITEVDNAKSDVLGASADSFTGLSAEFQAITDAAADITELNTISVDSDSALASTVAGMKAEMYDPVSGTLSLATKTDVTDLESTIYGASAESFTGLSAQFQDITDARADITQLNTISTSSGSALARKVANIESVVDGLESGTAGGASIAYVDATAATIYGASASSFTGLTATFSNLNDDIDAKATITDVNEVLANGNSTTAVAVKQLAAGVVDSNQTLIDVTAKADALGGQYTVKIDTSGYVSGYGLATTSAVDSTPQSEFYVRADKFAVGYPGRTDIVPFVVRTYGGWSNGVYIPAGVYIQGANIMNGTIDGVSIKNSTITDSHLVSVTAGKITSGDIAVGNTIESASYSTGNYGWRIDGAGNATFNGGTFNNITVKDAAGNIILSSGKVLASKVDGLGALATANSLSYTSTALTNKPTLGALAARNTVSSTYISDLSADKITTGSLNVTTELKSANYSYNNSGWLIDGNGNVVFNQGTFRGITVRDSSGNIILSSGRVQTSGIDGLGGLATQNSVSYTAVTGTKPPTDADKTSANVAAGIAGQGNLATLNTVTGTYIANYAVSELKLGTGAVTTAKIETGAVTETKIANAAITTAKIDNAAITTAKIDNAAVDTLSIQGNAVTVPASASGVYSASVVVNASVDMHFVLIGVFTQGSSRQSYFWYLQVDGNNVQIESPVEGTTGAMAKVVQVAPGNHTFSIHTDIPEYHANCTISVLGVKR